MEQTIEIDFHGDNITLIIKNEIPYVALKTIAESLGLAWNSQLRNIKRSRILSKGMLNLSIPSDGGGQEMTCLPLKYLNGWLFRIDLSRYSGERLEKLEAYQEKCYDVLHNYFQHGGAIDPGATPLQMQILEAQLAQMKQNYAPETPHGAMSAVSSRPRTMTVHAYFRAIPRKPEEMHTPNLFQFDEEQK